MASITIKTKLSNGSVIEDPVTGTRYLVQGTLGQGGFGCAHQVVKLTGRDKPSREEYCLKVTGDVESWHREAYYGEMLRGRKRAIQMKTSFVFVPPSGKRTVSNCLLFELADATVGDVFVDGDVKWSSTRVTRELAALLDLLDELHLASICHRDITPMNVFVCGNILKLGDYGIAKRDGRKTAFNPGFAPPRVDFSSRRWKLSDDIYQMGQLGVTLLTGMEKSSPAALKRVACDAHLKSVLMRAVGPSKQRYANAQEMRRALLKEDLPSTGIRSLKGQTVVFTGPLSMPRFDAELLVRQAGGEVRGAVTANTTVIVQGGRSPNYSRGIKGNKLVVVEKLRKAGKNIAVIGENQFRELVR